MGRAGLGARGLAGLERVSSPRAVLPAWFSNSNILRDFGSVPWCKFTAIELLP